MRRAYVIILMVLVVGALVCPASRSDAGTPPPPEPPPPTSSDGLNTVLTRLLSNNCQQLGGAGTTRGPLFNLCSPVPTSGVGSGGGAVSIVESRIGDSEEQRRQAQRLAERRAGRGGSADQPGTGLGIFMSGDYQFLKKDTTRFETGSDQHTAGTTVGADYSFRGRAVLGVAFNYAHEFGDFSGVAGGFDNDRYGVTLYGSVVPIDDLFVDMFLGYTHKNYSFDRRVHLEVAPDPASPSPTRVALGRVTADTNSEEVHAGVTVGYDFILGSFTVGPRVGVNYRDAGIDSYREHGNTGIELIYNNQNIVSLTTTAGVFASMAISTPFGVLLPQATAEYVHEFENDQRSVGFTFVYSAPRPQFLYRTEPPDRDFFNVGLGTVFVFPGGMSTFVNVRQLLGYENRTATSVTAGLRIPF